MFFTVTNLVMCSLLLGIVFILAILLPSWQKAVLWLILLCRPGDKALRPIILNRLESCKVRNMKISLMVTCSIAFLLYQASSQFTVLEYFKGMWWWFIAGDILITCT